ncbi:hypothetical protein R3W88_018992 [Solanum pinnatisectum]|uniref:Integrase core domain containing protein n=1 Tax=Solanum pinnatisectum TaxID=50273 RepID=A0AAV9KKE7_9SOLN|nr:hypothetical protein R3W88_018992 [Solanum pinnatisectum]
MQKSIAESEVKMEKRMATMVDQKIQAVHKRLDAFELRVLKRPAPTTDLSSFQTELASLRVDLDTILVPPTDELESSPNVLADDTVLGALFSEDIAQPKPTHARGKRHRSSHNSDTTKKARAKKQERQQTEQAQKASIIDEELRQQKVLKSALGASSFVPIVEVPTVERDDVSTIDGAVRAIDSTTESARLDDVGTTEGNPSVVPTGSRKLDSPTC